MEEGAVLERKIYRIDLNHGLKIPTEEEKADVVVVSTYFSPEEKNVDALIDIQKKAIKSRLNTTYETLNLACDLLKSGGLLFVYGLPKWLPYFGEYLTNYKKDGFNMLFKYWIALDIDAKIRTNALNPSHMGLLMFLKTRSIKNPDAFHLNTKTVRVPYKKCEACGKIIKDWGGKKHLMNPLGAAISDVWRDFPKREIRNYEIQEDIIKRIYDLTVFSNFKFFHIVDKISSIRLPEYKSANNFHSLEISKKIKDFQIDVVIHDDAISYMKNILYKFPEGIFDLVFADPPYNLEKNYNLYNDNTKEEYYLDWSYKWLELMAKVVKPGGTLMVLNLPKWCIHYATFLNSKLIFKNWIVWDAMSVPAGKIMPAHYALLYYTKFGGKNTFNYSTTGEEDDGKVHPIDADKYCLRSSCIKKRKKEGIDDKVDLTDIWWDIHRIKHRAYRDNHPCQLPLKLMERIIKLTTNEGDIVFDPFSGAGTTAVASKMLNRHYVTVDIDKNYVEITKRNLEKLQPKINGGYYLPRQHTKKEVKDYTKKDIEISYISLCLREKELIEIDKLKAVDEQLYNKILKSNIDFKYLKKIANRRLEIFSSADFIK